MKKIIKKGIYSLLALLPIPSIAYSAELYLHDKEFADNLKLESLKIQEFRSLIFPAGSKPIEIDQAYKKFHTIFNSYDNNSIEEVFSSYVDELINTGRLHTDGKIISTGNHSGDIAEPMKN